MAPETVIGIYGTLVMIRHCSGVGLIIDLDRAVSDLSRYRKKNAF